MRVGRLVVSEQGAEQVEQAERVVVVRSYGLVRTLVLEQELEVVWGIEQL
jgi:hypothetical protein